MTEDDFKLKLENIGYRASHQDILTNISVQASARQGLVVMGESGQGKTTLIKLIAGLELPSRGRVIFNDIEISKLNERERAHFRRQFMGIAFQNPHIIPSLSVAQNIMLAEEIHNPDGWGKTDNLQQIMDRFEISHRKNAYVDTLSGGEARRVALARAFVNNPKIVLLDEPLTGLDPDMAARITDEIIKLKEELGALLVIATHNVKINKAGRVKLNLDEVKAANTPEIDTKIAAGGERPVEAETSAPQERSNFFARLSGRGTKNKTPNDDRKMPPVAMPELPSKNISSAPQTNGVSTQTTPAKVNALKAAANKTNGTTSSEAEKSVRKSTTRKTKASTAKAKPAKATTTKAKSSGAKSAASKSGTSAKKTAQKTTAKKPTAPKPATTKSAATKSAATKSAATKSRAKSSTTPKSNSNKSGTAKKAAKKTTSTKTTSPSKSSAKTQSSRAKPKSAARKTAKPSGKKSGAKS